MKMFKKTEMTEYYEFPVEEEISVELSKWLKKNKLDYICSDSPYVLPTTRFFMYRVNSEQNFTLICNSIREEIQVLRLKHRQADKEV